MWSFHTPQPPQKETKAKEDDDDNFDLFGSDDDDDDDEEEVRKYCQIDPRGWGTPYSGLHERLCSKGVPSSGFRFIKGYALHKLRYTCMKGFENLSFNYFKGPLIKIFQTDAPYGCIRHQALHENDKKTSFFGDLFIIRASYERM